LTEDLTISLLGFLADAGLIVEVSLDDRGEEDPALAQWSFHDLLFHSRSRSGTHDYPIGGTYPFLNVIPSLPALKPIMSENTVVLPKPDIRQLEDDDPPLAKVMETRKSVRRYGRQPIKTEQLSEFLYRVARVRWVADPDPARLLYYQVTDRPYPSGGACYDLELYIIANSCTGIAQGIYHYDPCDHQLCMVSQPNASMDALLSDAKRSAGLVVEPQILVVLSSRFQRLSWKYSGIAYATTLKNVGVLYQSMYLAATAMGLAPCALGAGNASLFAQAVQSEYFAESSVGEFLLGTSAQTDVGDFATMVGERWAQLWTQYQDPHDPQVCKNELVSTNDGEKRWKCCKLWQRKLSNKLNAKAFAQRHGVPVAKLLWNGPLDEVPYDHLTETYVLKLSNGSNGDQVIPVSQGYDVLHKVHVDSDSLRRRVYQMFAELNDPNSLVLLEEFIGDPLDGVPLDYKFFCFHGKVKVLYISNRNSGTLTWFDDAWEPIRETIHTSKPPGQERRPPNADQLIEAAEHLARAYEHSLVRIDLYNPGDSVFFGEFTHAPFGGDLGRFTDFANKALAELWLHPEMKYSDARRIHSG
jgi:SagB-type dehydrogenase family enzyme